MTATIQRPGVIGATILTRSGVYFDFERPEISIIDPCDIAQGLSMTCRFGGQTTAFYSVAQHSVLVSEMVPAEHAFTALMHDAAEAYIGDIPSPLKGLLPDYKAVELRVEKAIAARFDLPFPFPPCIKHADLRALATEREDVMPPSRDGAPWPWMADYPRHPDRIVPQAPEEAGARGLERFDALYCARLAAA